MSILSLTALGLAAVSIIGRAVIPETAPEFVRSVLVWVACLGGIVFLVAITRAFREGREERHAGRTEKARQNAALAERLERASKSVLDVVTAAREGVPPLENPIQVYGTTYQEAVERTYAEAKGSGFRSDGVEKLMGTIRSVDDLERLSNSLAFLSKEIASS